MHSDTVTHQTAATSLSSSELIRLWVLQIVLVGCMFFELARGWLFLFDQPRAFGLTLRPLVDAVIARQYGLFSLPVALFYLLLARHPLRFRRLLWVAVGQRVVEALLIMSDPVYAQLPLAQIGLLAAPSLVFGLLIILFYPRTPPQSNPAGRTSPLKRGRGLRRMLVVFGAFQLFWAGASIIFLALGEQLLQYRVNDAFMTRQQGVAVGVIALASLVTATNVRYYRSLSWVLASSQVLGLFNAAYEASVGTIRWDQAALQWVIQLAIIVLFVVLYRRTPNVDQR